MGRKKKTRGFFPGILGFFFRHPRTSNLKKGFFFYGPPFIWATSFSFEMHSPIFFLFSFPCSFSSLLRLSFFLFPISQFIWLERGKGEKLTVAVHLAGEKNFYHLFVKRDKLVPFCSWVTRLRGGESNRSVGWIRNTPNALPNAWVGAYNIRKRANPISIQTWWSEKNAFPLTWKH